ncbi:hypothetical protein [Pseudoruegeria sp. SHC-113]|uniref:hypothetical protein n=1 Tax=Pseudoruegeria sp. SHC-113 TaxID=2855439 RepID=UPI0021BA7600|nr:hypothetical protein [Pseudoruegeria sp. SHC-113]MCT8160015.1 hypothetical protein [Pseudoruegeria sp. SHC-113]
MSAFRPKRLATAIGPQSPFIALDWLALRARQSGLASIMQHDRLSHFCVREVLECYRAILKIAHRNHDRFHVQSEEPPCGSANRNRRLQIVLVNGGGFIGEFAAP